MLERAALMRVKTDACFVWMGDQPGMWGPVRDVKLLATDGDRYALIEYGGIRVRVLIDRIAPIEPLCDSLSLWQSEILRDKQVDYDVFWSNNIERAGELVG